MSKPVGALGHCIVCHRDNVPMSDEHVIPKAIGGCYHVYNVCDNCNSNRFGSKIDPLLTDHPLIQLVRWQKKIKSYKGSFPHPLSNPQVADDGTRYYVKENGVVLEPHIFPKTEITRDKHGKLSSVKLTIDLEQESEADGMLDKVLAREGIDLSKVTIEKTIIRDSFKPVFHYNWVMDIHDFNLDLLKMAYEFTCDSLPNYEDDETAKKIADVLCSCDPKRLDEVTMANYKIDKLVENAFGEYVDFSSDDRHYLFLMCKDKQLVCIVRLFNGFCTGFLMSEIMGGDTNKTRILINDTAKHTYENYTLKELIDKIAGPIAISFDFDKKRYKGTLKLKKTPNAADYFVQTPDSEVALFDKNGAFIGDVSDCVQTIEEQRIKNSIACGIHTINYFPTQRRYIQYKATGELIPIKTIISKSKLTKI